MSDKEPANQSAEDAFDVAFQSYIDDCYLSGEINVELAVKWGRDYGRRESAARIAELERKLTVERLELEDSQSHRRELERQLAEPESEFYDCPAYEGTLCRSISKPQATSPSEDADEN